MGTRSLIGKQLNDGSILGVYCHYDGYPEFNGRVLRDNFDTADKVAALIDGGDMSCTWTNAGWGNETLPESGALYYTSRGEKIEDNAPRVDDNIVEYLNDGEEYAYIFNNFGEWICYDLHDTTAKLTEIPAGPVA